MTGSSVSNNINLFCQRYEIHKKNLHLQEGDRTIIIIIIILFFIIILCIRDGKATPEDLTTGTITDFYNVYHYGTRC